MKYKGYEIVKDPSKYGPVLIMMGGKTVATASGEHDAKIDIDNNDLRMNGNKVSNAAFQNGRARAEATLSQIHNSKPDLNGIK